MEHMDHMDHMEYRQPTHLALRRPSLLVAIMFMAVAAPGYSWSGQADSPLRAKTAPKYSKEFNKCMSKSGGITSVMLNCIGDETVRWKQRLDAAYRKTLNGASPRRKQMLERQHRAFVRRRTKTCEELDQGGTLGTLADADCFMERTALEALRLEAALAKGER